MNHDNQHNQDEGDVQKPSGNTGKPEQENQAPHAFDDNSQVDKFAHLKKSVNVKSHSQSQMLMIGMVVMLIFAALCFFMLSGRHHSPKATFKNTNVTQNNAILLQENEARLKALQHEQRLPAQGQMRLRTSTSNDKAFIARRNAPTELFSLQGGSSANENAATQSGLAGKGSFATFANSQSTGASAVTATELTHPHYTIAEGEFIHATLETAINSDMPGMVRAVITRPVYAFIGEAPLIPAGSRLIGQYSSTSSNGNASTRVFVMWNRIITPTGISMIINSPGTDNLGRAGMGADKIDTHFWKMFGTASLLSIMSAASSTVGVSSTAQPNSANQYQQSIASGFQQAAQNSLSQNLSIKPTLHIYQGDSINVFVAHDIDLYSVLGQSKVLSGYASLYGGFIK